MFDLKDKVIVVTGAAGTLCSAIVEDFAKNGARVALLGRTRSKVVALSEKLNNEGCCTLGICADVTSELDLKEALAIIKENWGDPDILINGAGGKDHRALTEGVEFTPEELSGDANGFFGIHSEAFDAELAMNIQGTVLPSKIFGAGIARKGKGSIINFASMNSYRPLSRAPAYAIAKAGILNFTQWLAAYLAPAGVRVNAVAPGFFINERSRKLLMTDDGGFSERGQQVVSHTPMKRFGEAAEMVGAVRYLIDDQQAAFVTGICLPVDGGFLSCSGL
ncbi:MAG TPA: D-mannonate oxidoreductase [Opitutae bacterium]|nr:D-mannonate oxidoreductase [Puniceicoccaceae bacterium]HBR94393.1 D-mannonate oxidoreductase [Opitutae bacterium]|tara:strand:- start:4496 stop:5329 length:834 start_codon:yes stop_codon:yes gene_type:complete